MSTDFLKPKTKQLVFDLVNEAGFDVSDWKSSAKNPGKVKANPKYCYNWSFLHSGDVLILNLWFDRMISKDGSIRQILNLRSDADDPLEAGAKPSWRKRALQFDRDVHAAFTRGLPVRVIINDGEHRDSDDPLLRPSKVHKRELDPELWSIAEYDESIGQTLLIRGLASTVFVDQFDIEFGQEGGGNGKNRTAFVYDRDSRVRDEAKRRANGKCEHCGEPGFRTSTGAIYLETHHIIPLSEGGFDKLWNVVALCPGHHRMAHFGQDREAMRERLRKIVADKH